MRGGGIGLFALVLVMAGSLWLALTVRSLHRLSRAVSATPPGDDLQAAVSGPLWDYTGTFFAAMLLGSLLLAVGIVLWGLVSPAR